MDATQEAPTQSRVLRYEVPVDDAWHRIEIGTDIAHVGCRSAWVVEFWTVPSVMVRRVTTGIDTIVSERFEYQAERPRARWFRVYGTGHPLQGGTYVGTTPDVHPSLIWHLFVRDTDPAADPSLSHGKAEQ